MDRYTLIDEIVSLCFDYDGVVDGEIKAKVESKLAEPQFVENLINTIIIKSRDTKNVNINQIKALLLELERIRLDLEYKDCTLV
jgi:hypothetical protein